MSGLSYKLKISSNIKILIVPVITITVIVFMLIVFAPQSVSKIDQKMKEHKSSQSKEASLNEKLETLRKISPNLLDPSDVTVVALPSKNPAVWVVSHIKRLANEYEVDIEKISVSRSKETDVIKNSNIRIEVKAKDYPTFLLYANDLTKIFPFTSLKAVSVKRTSGQGEIGVFGVEIDTMFYWSDFPETLPPMDKPLNELTAENLNTIGQISDFKRPVFIELDPDEPKDRVQPFY